MSGWTRAHPWQADILTAAVVGVPLVALSLWVVVVAAPRPWPAVVLGVAVVVAQVAVAFRRVSPLASFVVVCGAFAAQTLASGLFLTLPSVVVFPLSLYSYCAWGRRPSAPAVGLAVGAVGAVVVTVRFALDPSVKAANLHPSPWLLFGLLLAVVLAAWSLGLFRRIQLAYVALLQERARRAEADRAERARRAVLEERARIAREMHDVVAHSLAVIISQARGGRYAADANPDRAGRVLGTIEETGRQALADMRGLLGMLRSGGWAGGDDGRGPQPTLGELPELLDRVRAAGLPVHHAEQGTPRPLSPAAELAVFRLVQEALTNTINHASADARAEVRLVWAAEEVTVTVRDDGRGPPPSDGSSTGGHGLLGLRERLAAVGGSLSAGPLAGGGFLVQTHLPYPAGWVEEGRA